MTFEFVIDDILSLSVANYSNAERIEFCRDLFHGGVTPLNSDIKLIRKNFDRELVVMIRPNYNNFIYSNRDFEEMKRSILLCKESGINGVIFGILNSNNEVDLERSQILLELAYPMYSCYHRAFDVVPDKYKLIDLLVYLGFKRILTSGGHINAIDGLKTIIEYKNFANSRIDIMPGGNINYTNFKGFLDSSVFDSLHVNIKSGKDKLDMIFNPEDFDLFYK